MAADRGFDFHPVRRIDGQHPNLVRSEAQHSRSPGQRGVALIGDVGHDVVGHRPDHHGLPGAGECGEVGGGAAGDQHPACSGG